MSAAPDAKRPVGLGDGEHIYDSEVERSFAKSKTHPKHARQIIGHWRAILGLYID